MFTTCALFASRKLLQLCSCNDMNGSCDVKAFGFQEKVDMFCALVLLQVLLACFLDMS